MSEMAEITNKLTDDERETIITIRASDRDNAHIFTDDPVMARRIQRKGWIPTVNDGKRMEFEVENSVSIRAFSTAPKRQMTEEQRAAASARMIVLNDAKRAASMRDGELYQNDDDQF